MEVPLSNFEMLVEKFLSVGGLPSIEDRYNQLSHVDPFPNIPSALLHSGHIASYLIAAGIIDPFEISDLSKPATYLIPLEGDVRFIDEKGNVQSFYLSNKSTEGQHDTRSFFDLHPNSLCYVTLKPTFRMPAYIAGRFNLLIRDVYRGLLVGTGPLVDPGFVGQLHVPLHNFTSTKYRFQAGEGFVYFEFTKLSWKNNPGITIPSWVPSAIDDQPPFPKTKNKRKTLDDYIYQATGGGPPGNELVTKLRTITEIADTARQRLNIITLGGIAAAVIFLVTVLSVIIATWQVHVGYSQSYQGMINELNQSIDKQKTRIEDLERKLNQ